MSINNETPEHVKFSTAFDLLQDEQRISTGCKKIDDLIGGGGIHIDGITELAGESGAGKTQFCMQLCLTVQYLVSHGGLNGGAIYVCTEDPFPIKRFKQMIDHFPSKYYQNVNQEINFGSNVFIKHIPDFPSLRLCLSKEVPMLLKTKCIKLIVVDSIAGVFRGAYDNIEGSNRTRDLREIGNLLHKISFDNRICIVCVNQVTDVLNVSDHTSVPALGLAWANMITTRLQLYNSGGNKLLRVIFAPDIKKCSINLNIHTWGVRGE